MKSFPKKKSTSDPFLDALRKKSTDQFAETLVAEFMASVALNEPVPNTSR